MSWLESFVWTCAIEAPVYIVLLRSSFRRAWAPVAIALGLQLATHPLLWALFPGAADRWTTYAACEAVVALVEGLLVALLLRRQGEPRPLRRGLFAGFAANALSAAVGALLLI